MELDRLLELERAFWTAGGEFYEEHLASDCLMVFPGMGVLDRAAAIAGLGQGPRWSSVQVTDPRLVELAGDAAVLTYTAEAQRPGADAQYRARIVSAYTRRDGGWKLAFHQHAPPS